ncbi:MAG: serine/threonine protein kinase, partial [Candidatus Bathyarchaeota archaeon]|nr:serine/threonine protein kinase [Candidatus Bathyarchaeota archaeon]
MRRHDSTQGFCLGIEATADDFSVGVLDFGGKVLANIIDVFMPETGGIHPREAARHHAEVAGEVVSKAFQQAGITPKDVAIVAFSQGPGL